MQYNPYAGVQNPYLSQNPYSQQNPYAQEQVSVGGYQEFSTFFEPSGPSPLTCCRFDSFRELLWTGTSNGRIVSYETPMMERYTAWQAHSPKYTIKDIIPVEEGILSLSANALKYSTRGGVTMSNYLVPDQSVELMAMLSVDHTNVLFGGSGDSLYFFDLVHSSLVQEFQIPNGITCLKRARHLYCGTPEGTVLFCDLRTNRVEHTFKTPFECVHKLTAKADILVASGSGQNGYDSVLNTFDLRMNRPLSSVNMPYNFRVSEIGFHPKFSTTIIATSNKGFWQMIEVNDASPSTNQQRFPINCKGRPISSFDIASSGEVFAFTDLGGLIHLFSDIGAEDPDFAVNQYSLELEYADDVPPSPYVDDEGSLDILNAVEMFASYPQSDLFSNWNGSMYFSVALPPEEPLPLELMDQVRYNGYLGVLQTTPGQVIRNKVSHSNPLAYPSNWDVSLNDYVDQSQIAQGDETDETEAHAEQVVQERREYKARPPKTYQFLQIKQNIKGYLIDMSSHNTTALCGLDNTSAKSFINALLNVYYWITPLYYMCRGTIMDEEHSVITELGLLFIMMDEAKGGYVEARNFFRAIQHIPSFVNSGLLVMKDEEKNLAKHIEKLNTLFFEQIMKEETQFHKFGATKTDSIKIQSKIVAPQQTNKKTTIDQIFGSVVRITNICLTCNNETVLDTHHSSYTLTFPEMSTSFATVLVNTLYQTNQSYSWCENCQSFQLSSQRKEPVNLPNLLTLNCTAASHQFWSRVGNTGDHVNQYGNVKRTERKDHWIPFFIEIITDQKTRKLQVKEVSENADINSLGKNVYILSSVISNIHDHRSDHKNHLVAQIRVNQADRCKRKHLQEGSWYLFNDFKISLLSKYEAVSIDSHWKTPIMLNYIKFQKNPNSAFTALEQSLSQLKSPLDDQIFFTKRLPSFRDSRNKNSTSYIQSFYPLRNDEIPLKPGALIALDTEYFRVVDEEQQRGTLSASGSLTSPMKVQQTKQMSFGWARVSVLRSWGDQSRAVFIDDYICTDEAKIQDYLTQYSGLRLGDLDPSKSPHHVISHKIAYLKMRRLADLGCIFVGHGLKQDFSIINLYVRPENIIDTVDLYYLPGNRRLSLRFLAQVFLGTNIQQEIHDSIEDAKTALLLYQNYIRMKESMRKGYTFEDIMQKVYYVGELIFWKSEDFQGDVKKNFQKDLREMNAMTNAPNHAKNQKKRLPFNSNNSSPTSNKSTASSASTPTDGSV